MALIKKLRKAVKSSESLISLCFGSGKLINISSFGFYFYYESVKYVIGVKF